MTNSRTPDLTVGWGFLKVVYGISNGDFYHKRKYLRYMDKYFHAA